jgi:hypothetical protein
MLEIGGEEYYFDLEKMSQFVRYETDNNIVDDVLGSMDEDENNKEIVNIDFNNDPTQMIDITKWEMIRNMTETLLTDQSIIDDRMGAKALQDLSIPVKLSFNTLIKHNIIRTNG